jgi:hypothetical protein
LDIKYEVCKVFEVISRDCDSDKCRAAVKRRRCLTTFVLPPTKSFCPYKIIPASEGGQINHFGMHLRSVVTVGEEDPSTTPAAEGANKYWKGTYLSKAQRREHVGLGSTASYRSYVSKIIIGNLRSSLSREN